MITEYNNRQGKRDCQSHCCIVSGKGEVYAFDYKGVPEVFSVAVKDREKNGKWSNTTWNISHSEATTVVSWLDDYNTGFAIPQLSWEEAYLVFKIRAPALSREKFEAYIRSGFPNNAKRLDDAAAAEKEFGVYLTADEAAKVRAAREVAEKELADYRAEQKTKEVRFREEEAVRMATSPFASLLSLKT